MLLDDVTAGDLDAASSMVSRSMRLRDEAEDIEGRVYGWLFICDC